MLIVMSALTFSVLVIPQLLILSSPAAVLTKSFSIYCLQQIDPEICMLPEGGRFTIHEVEVVREVLEPGFSPVAALPEAAQEEAAWSSEPN